MFIFPIISFGGSLNDVNLAMYTKEKRTVCKEWFAKFIIVDKNKKHVRMSVYSLLLFGFRNTS